jgi:hypothetical protein
MQKTFIPLCQALHIRSDPYWYWDACFDSEKDWELILEREHKDWELRFQAAIKRMEQKREAVATKFYEDNNRAFAIWEAQVRGRMEGMTVRIEEQREYAGT